MELRFVQVDAFADRPFGGNPAAVMPLDAWLPDETLQAIAAENNLAETAFTVPTDGDADYELRWFTPTQEVALCGHATLASGHVLMIEAEQMRFNTRKAGVLIVGRDGDGLTLDLPVTLVRPSSLRLRSETASPMPMTVAPLSTHCFSRAAPPSPSSRAIRPAYPSPMIRALYAAR